MNIKLLTEHYFAFLSLKGRCIGSSESTLVKMPHCWKSHVTAQISLRKWWSMLVIYDIRVRILCCAPKTRGDLAAARIAAPAGSYAPKHAIKMWSTKRFFWALKTTRILPSKWSSQQRRRCSGEHGNKRPRTHLQSRLEPFIFSGAFSYVILLWVAAIKTLVWSIPYLRYGMLRTLVTQEFLHWILSRSPLTRIFTLNFKQSDSANVIKLFFHVQLNRPWHVICS